MNEPLIARIEPYTKDQYAREVIVPTDLLREALAALKIMQEDRRVTTESANYWMKECRKLGWPTGKPALQTGAATLPKEPADYNDPAQLAEYRAKLRERLHLPAIEKPARTKSVKRKWEVEIVARERGEGSKLLKTRTFKTYAAAKRYADKWNREKCPPRDFNNIPDYYEAAYVI